ncbi:MAG: LLM class flavin-dependent oxidoreductase [Actinomycetota bacterium]|nr:LLM class flavin-dependent oxidoreductase [Actinomycetota bacterium]
MILDTEFNSAAQIPSEICLPAAVEAERRGFGCIWKGESNSRDPMVLLSAMAAQTSTVELGTAIYHLFGRSPVTLAVQAATFNEMSGGRLIVGLGVGNPIIAGWHGQQFSRPLARMREYLEVVRAVYSGERVPDIEGDFFSVSKGFKLAFTPPEGRLRLYVAGLGPQMVGLAGRLGDGIVINMADGEMIKEVVSGFREAAVKAGRDPNELEVVSKIRVCLHEDPAQARWALKKVLTFYSLQQGYSDLLRKMGWPQVVDRVQELHRTEGFAAARKSIPDEMVDAVPMYAGSDLSGLAAKLAVHEAAGVDRCDVAYVPADDTRQWEEIQSFLAQAEPLARKGGR